MNKQAKYKMHKIKKESSGHRHKRAIFRKTEHWRRLSWRIIYTGMKDMYICFTLEGILWRE
jgi:hypothetical protein